jgi:hypothetical protein
MKLKLYIKPEIEALINCFRDQKEPRLKRLERLYV